MTHLERKREIAIGAIPKKGTQEYKKITEFLEKNESPESKEFGKKNWERANSSLEAQYHSHSNLVTEKNLRHFLLEFNNRAWDSGLWSMPTMFNVMESFFNYRKPEVYFELLEEENYYANLVDFLDFVTSDQFSIDRKVLDKNISENIVYNFEFTKDFDKISFKNSNGYLFLVRGLSLIRRGNEVTLSIVTGKKKNEDDILEKDIYKTLKSPSPDKDKIVQKVKEDLENKGLKYEYLDNEEEYIKTIITIRLDIENLTIDSRYIALETNLMFNITTDDRNIFTDKEGRFLTEQHEEAYKRNIEEINKYDAIYDLVNYLIYLPYYFNINEDNIKSEDLETEYKNLIKNPLKKRKFQNTLGYKSSIKPVYYLDKDNNLSPTKIILRDDLFKVEKSGFWKTLSPDEVGLDKKGNTIHGRTWVNQSLAWFEAKEDELLIEEIQPQMEGPDVGYIYILRNPIMGNNVFKIGLTRNDVDFRVSQLSKTSVPDKFYKVQEWLVKDCVLAEKQIHESLNDYRVDPRREFFELRYDKAVDVIVETIRKINE